MELIVCAPGRINLIGEHTDYNDGFVLPAAISRHIQFHLKVNGTSNTCRFRTEFDGTSFSADLRKLKPVKNGWGNYLVGVLSELQQRTDRLRGFDCQIESDLPPGSGLSSSAALECGLAIGLNEMLGIGLTQIELIHICQTAEHNFAGTRCGVMDQFASVMGRSGHFIALDCKDLSYKYIPAHLGDYELVLLKSGVTHDLAESAYNTRREECETGVAILQQRFPQVHSLRDATLEMLSLSGSGMPEVIARRCQYVIEENQRVRDAVTALNSGDMVWLGRLLFASHAGMRDLYEISCPELDFLVESSSKWGDVAGSRMMGGGFGGCSLNLVKRDAITRFCNAMEQAYRKNFNRSLPAWVVTPGNGVSVIKVQG